MNRGIIMGSGLIDFIIELFLALKEKYSITLPFIDIKDSDNPLNKCYNETNK